MISNLERTLHFIIEHRSNWTREVEFYLYGSKIEAYSKREERIIATKTISEEYLDDLFKICETLGIEIH